MNAQKTKRMPSNKPRRFRNPFLPIRQPSFAEQAIITAERIVKGSLFACSMCGNCILQETAFICPLRCPKGLRNGPCGSGSLDHCCVDPMRPCVWHLIYRRSDQMGRLDRLLEVQAPLDWARVGHETWASLISLAYRRGLFAPGLLLQQVALQEKLAQLFCDLRQPDWWKGDSDYHAPRSVEPVSVLQAGLQRGEFVVTAEITPPLGTSPDSIVRNARSLHGAITAGNFTDNPMATVRMSSLACSLMLLKQGIEPVMQMTARDYNRLSLQSEILGAAALGIRNVLCLTGDPPMAGRVPYGGVPFDIDVTQMLWIVRRMRDEGIFLDGRPIKQPPALFLGTAGSPNTDNPRYDVLRLKKKVNTGAQFIQTQLIYDLDIFKAWMEEFEIHIGLDKVYILPGVGPIHSVKAAYFLARIPGIRLPQTIIQRIERAKDPEEEGIQLALEIIEQLKRIPGVSGIHLMAMGRESAIPRIVTEAGLLPHSQSP